ncbi:enoyl-CoA hydratase [Pelagibacterium montanilacus]|uniref:enoyl-CoA hydratase n=1 Tax=Pelagibacterium montanilacus TaxID=2185280 RepID=UPI000F8E5D91|nr:enoyl-CoA hydratase [Pelagibacterium montanilacus]
MSEGRVTLSWNGDVAHIRFDRPHARNAMTKSMYRDLAVICAELKDRAGVRMAVLRGEGGESFVAGSDISIFEDFDGPDDGIAYEAEMERYTFTLQSLPFPTLAVIEAWAVGGGLNLAAACDLRVAVPGTRFGVPIARTVGNCLSMPNYQRLVHGFGASRAKRMLIMGDFLSAEEAREAGFIMGIVDPAEVEAEVERITRRVCANAPITMEVSKEAIARVGDGSAAAAGEDLIGRAYGSADFHIGVSAFRNKEEPVWTGR